MLDLKIPTQQDIASYISTNPDSKWTKLPEGWRCPSCDRSKIELVRWVPNSDGGKWGDFAIHLHHDHASKDSATDRFPETEVCLQCNAADGRVKRLYGFPKNFSFSAEEISRFVRGVPHGLHVIDYDKAGAIYLEICAKNGSPKGEKSSNRTSKNRQAEWRKRLSAGNLKRKTIVFPIGREAELDAVVAKWMKTKQEGTEPS